MNMENQPLITYELVGFEKQPIELQEFWDPYHFEGIYDTYLTLIKKTRKMPTCE